MHHISSFLLHEFRVKGTGVPTSFPLGDDGLAVVSAFSQSLTFQFLTATVHVDEEVFDTQSGQLTHTVMQLPTVNEDGKVWLLRPGRYRAYGLTDSLIGASTELLMPKESSTCTMQTTLLVCVKVEPGLETIFELSDDEVPEDLDHNTILVFSSHPNPQSSAGSCPSTSKPPTHSPSDNHSVVKCLKLLGARKGSRNVFKQIDYNSIDIRRVQFLPPHYDGDVIFEFPPLGSVSKQCRAK